MKPVLKIYCDGGARGNPGPGAASFVVIDKEGSVIKKESKFLGEVTNNIAEYRAVILALRFLSENSYNSQYGFINFYLDSELVVKQLTGEFRVKNRNLKDLFLKVKILEQKVGKKIFYNNVPREQNKLADYLVNQKLDES